MKKLAFLLALCLSAPIQAETTCADVYDRIQYTKQNISSLWQELSLVRLELVSYNPDTKEGVAYQQLKATFDSYSENYNAVVANHNQMITQYQEVCE